MKQLTGMLAASVEETCRMRAWGVPLVVLGWLSSLSLAQSPGMPAEPAAKLLRPVAVETVARGAAPSTEEERRQRARAMRDRYEAEPDRNRGRRPVEDDIDDKPIRRVSQEELWDYIDTPRHRRNFQSDYDRDGLLPERKNRPSSRAGSRRYDDEDDDRRTSGRIGDRIRDWMDFDKPDGFLQSDRCFESMVSPVSNPFLFEDPRALTEIRPLFIYQRIPSPQPNTNGGNIWFVGTQARIAFTERLSLTLNKLGFTAINPSNDFWNRDNTGFSEIWLGPKITIIRDEEFGTLLAAGTLFQIPAGKADVFQDTGRLSIVPYVSLAQPFMKTRLGTFNGLVNTGYSFSTNKLRSDYYYLNGHMSFDLGNAQRIFPLAEFTWTHYTTNGMSFPVSGEGRDLINFGGIAKGSSLLTGALGARFRLTKNLDIGGAFELPLAGNKDFFGHRFTVDFIWRY